MATSRAMLRVVAVNLGLLFAIVILAELVFGRWFESRPELALLRVARDLELRFDTSLVHPEGGLVIYRRDQYGLRGAYEHPSRIDILAIGGSTTNELHIAEGATWTDVLAARFRAAGRPVSVVNAGVEGQSTVGHLRNFDVWFPHIPDLRARYVLAYVGLNDMHIEGTAFEDILEPRSLRQRWMRLIRDRSALYWGYRTIDGMAQARRARLLHGVLRWDDMEWKEQGWPVTIPELKGEIARRLDRYGDCLAMLIESIRRFGAEPIIVTQRYAGYRRRGDRLFMADAPEAAISLERLQTQRAFNARTMAVCRAARSICIDLADEIEFEPRDFRDNVHTTPSGARRIGFYLYDKLKDVIR